MHDEQILIDLFTMAVLEITIQGESSLVLAGVRSLGEECGLFRDVKLDKAILHFAACYRSEVCNCLMAAVPSCAACGLHCGCCVESRNVNVREHASLAQAVTTIKAQWHSVCWKCGLRSRSTVISKTFVIS